MMKFIKRIFIVFFCIVIIAMIAGLFMKKDYHIEREVVINAPKDIVFNYIKHLKNQDNYSYWIKQDPIMKRDYKGEDAQIGFIAYWEGNDKVGKGEQEIIGIKEGERVDFEIRFKEPMEITNTAYMTTEPIQHIQTKVKWGFKGAMKYPMNVMMPFADIDNMLGSQLQVGLDELKAILEKIPTLPEESLMSKDSIIKVKE